MLRNKVKAVLIDLSGTIHVDDKPIAGAIEAINRLKAAGLPVIFATNTTKESRDRLHSKLNKIGFQIESKQIFSSLLAAQQLIVDQSLRPFLMVEEAAKDDFRSVCDVELPLDQSDSIVIGLSPQHFNYEQLNQVFQALLGNSKKLIAIHRSRYFQTSKGLALGPGPFVAALQFATGKQAQVVGKPEAFFFHQAIKQTGSDFDVQSVAMIGDDCLDDVLGAQKAGLIGMLVKTGKYLQGDETKFEQKPDFVFDSVVEAVDFILKSNQKFDSL